MGTRIFGVPLPLIAAAIVVSVSDGLQAGYKVGETLWRSDFTVCECAALGIPADVLDAQGGKAGDGALVFRLERKGNRKIVVRTGVKVSGVFLVEAVVKGRDVTRGPNGWNGPKVMFPYRRANGKTDNPQLRGVYGTYDWQTWSSVKAFPKQGSELVLVLGLEECAGEFQIDSIKVARAIETEDGAEACEVAVDPSLPRGKFLGRRNPEALRGVMSGSDMSEAAVDELAAWGVKLVRLQIGGLKDAGSSEGYRQALARQLAVKREIVDRLWTKGIRVVIDLHQGPGCAQNKILQNRLPPDYDAADLCRAWEMIARSFRGHPAVWGYDILNEPICAEGTWLRICREVMATVRKIDAETAFVVSIPDTRPFDWYFPDEKVIYSPHYYSPHALTHQGVINDGQVHWRYPGVIDGERWNRETIRRHLKPVIDFQIRHPDARIYVGEFSCIAWAAGDGEYVRDCISVFEEYGWDWTYHAYREWKGWDVDYDAVCDNVPKLHKPGRPSLRKRALLDGLSGNP